MGTLERLSVNPAPRRYSEDDVDRKTSSSE